MEITKPTLLVNEEMVKENIKFMANKVRRSNIRFRPHFKTHQSVIIGRWFREYGVTAITVSSLDMAKYFVEDGWEDIILAVPVSINQLLQINELAKDIKLGILVESTFSAECVADQISAPIDVWIEIDQGYHRTGVENVDEIVSILNVLKKNSHVRIAGLLTHAGHTYHAKTPKEIKDIYLSSVNNLIRMQRRLSELGFDMQLSIGDTPSCSLMEKFDGIDEIRPGNFVFYDLNQVELGVTEEQSVAICVACPVIAKYADRNEIVIHGGAVHLSKEFLVTPQGNVFFGKIVLLTGNNWKNSISNTFVTSISQEHGIISVDPSIIDSISIGDIIGILPVHSCLTANLFSSYRTLSGKRIANIHG